jgi:predicted O-linked N-acetylglucosamine transferase (SPINDLY family)
MTSISWQAQLQAAQQAAQEARFDAFLAECQAILDQHGNDIDAVLHIGSVLLAFGFLSSARKCFLHVQSLAPRDLRPLVNLANVAQQQGDHAECRRLYASALQHLSNHPVIRRNALLSVEYDPDITDAVRLSEAQAWGDWAVAQAGGIRARPELRPLDGRPLRIGYVSADLCQHTVGLFVKDILSAHDATRVAAYAYSAGQVDDWVTAAVRRSCTFRDVRALDDLALAAQIRADEIDVLVDLSGHTGGSRLTVFAHRPAPVQVSWLGYFATTGLSAIDAVILDEWHAPPGTEAQFAEPIIRLPHGRFCYTPVPFAPAEVAPPPSITKGYITFGSFNNTAKLNHTVFALWAQVLHAVPGSRLILKWRTFQDAEFRQTVHQTFATLGIDPQRVELRGASFHVDLLKEYADIDIALDPFPFTGGMTSCEALWMGVPVVTWPQGRVVSRQTHAFLHAIGLPELSASDAEDYVRIVTGLAQDAVYLSGLRNGMRDRMRASTLMDTKGFTRQLELCFIDLYLGIPPQGGITL